LYRKGYHIISYTNYCVEHNTREAKEKAKVCKVVLTVKDIITRYLNDKTTVDFLQEESKKR